MRKKGLHIAFYGLVFLLAVPVLQLQFKLFEEKPLNGAFTLAEKPAFSKETWKNLVDLAGRGIDELLVLQAKILNLPEVIK